MSLTYAERQRLKTHVERLEPTCHVCGSQQWEEHGDRLVAPVPQVGIGITAVVGLNVVVIICRSCRSVVMFDELVIQE